MRDQAERGHGIERDIVRAAMMRGGRITALDVKTRVVVPIETIEERLRGLHRLGYCESLVGEDGRHTYVFSDFDDAPMRAAAAEKRILQLAETHDGVVTVRAVALSTDLGYVEARAWLDRMVADEICTPTEEHDVYLFAPPRRRRVDVLDAEDASPSPPPRVRQ